MFRMPAPELADHRLLKPVDDFDDSALHPARAAGAGSLDLDAVAVHCRTHGARSNIEVLRGVFQGLVGNHKSVAVAVRYQAPPDQIRPPQWEWAFLST